MMHIRAHIMISGRVQGVCFRMDAQVQAERLGLTGWVRNLLNGDVEVVCEGPAPTVERMIAWCHQGPPAARVTQVRVEKDDPKGDLKGFEIR